MNKEINTQILEPIEKLLKCADPASLVAEYELQARQIENYSNDFPFAMFLGGRAYRQLGKHKQAEALLSQYVKTPNIAFWAWYELFMAQLALKDFKNCQEAVLKFVRAANEPLQKVHIEDLEAALNALYVKAHPKTDLIIGFRLLNLNTGIKDISKLRLAELESDMGNYSQADRLFEQIDRLVNTEKWAKFAKAKFLVRVGRFDEAELLFSNLLSKTPEFVFEVAYLDFLKKHRSTWDCFAYIDKKSIDELKGMDRFSHPSIRRLIIGFERRETRRSDVVKALEEEIKVGLDPQFQWYAHHYIEALYFCESELSAAWINTYVKDKLSAWLAPRQYAELILNLFTKKQEWDEVKRFTESQQFDLVKDVPNLRFKVFEYYCYSKQLDLARKQLKGIGLDRLDPFQNASVIRYFLEAKLYEQAENLLVKIIQAGGFKAETHLDLMVRTLRKSGGVDRAIGMVRKHIKEEKERNQILPTLYYDSIRGNGAVEHIKLTIQKSEDPKLGGILNVFSSPSPEAAETDRMIYFCVNSSYLLAGAVSLYSLLANNPDLTSVPFGVLVEDEILETAQAVYAKIFEAFGSSGIVLPASSLVAEDKLTESYGLFTGGHSLALAAYYRIYFAKYLQANTKAKQLLYIDSDTVIGHGLSEVFQTSRSSAVHARFEVQRPEVVKATKRHGIQSGCYFNSGILLFNVRNKAFEKCIDAAIHAAEKCSEELIFQDQCALNRGFIGQVSGLDERFNYFLSPHEYNSNFNSLEPVVMHFLDRPKPWDPLYTVPYQKIWWTYVSALRVVLGTQLLKELFSRSM